MDLKIMSKQDFILKMERLNINVGDIVYIETQLSPDFFNPVIANEFVQKMMDYLGEEGTLVMSMSGFNCSVDEESIDEDFIVPIDKDNLSLYCNSRLANFIYQLPYAEVSSNTSFPFVAYGKYAKVITSRQSVDFPNGVQSPFARLYELRAKVLLIEHNIKEFLLNEHCMEISGKTTVIVDNAIREASLQKYMRKNEKDFVAKLFASKKYKELFYYTSLKEISVLSVSVREYVDFCLRIIEG